MDKQPKINPALEALKADFANISEMLMIFAIQVVEEEISEYPVFIAADDPAPIGKLMLDKEQHQLNFNYNVSILEDFVAKKIVDREKVEEFMNTYGEATERACFLIMSEAGMGFVFLPYKSEGGGEAEVVPNFELN